MYFYHIIIRIYVLVFINIYSPIYFLRVTICYNHPSYYGFYTFTNYVKIFEDQYFNYPSQVYHMKLSTLYKKLFSSSEGVSKGLNFCLHRS
jgi:hypothetical protein